MATGSFIGPLSVVTDRYGRQARLLPALITCFPAVLLIVAWFPALWTTVGVLVSLVSSFGVTLLLSNLGRDRGKRLEPRLYQLWGGKPSVALLRHRDSRIDDHTKKRYRAFLARKLTDLILPSLGEEASDPAEADKAYESVTAWLLTQTRDERKFEVLFKENIAYGFRRNMWGLKSIGIIITIVAAAISTAVIVTKYFIGGDIPSPEVVIATTIVWILLLIWIAVVTPSWARIPADAYGMQLLAACDTFGQVSTTGGKPEDAVRPVSSRKKQKVGD